MTWLSDVIYPAADMRQTTESMKEFTDCIKFASFTNKLLYVMIQLLKDRHCVNSVVAKMKGDVLFGTVYSGTKSRCSETRG